MNKKIIFAVLVLLGLGFLPKVYGTIFNSDNVNSYAELKVTKVLDNAVLQLEDDQKLELIGVANIIQGEMYYAVSQEYIEEQLLNKNIYIEKDVLEKDEYGVIQGYVWLKKPSGNVDLSFIDKNLFNYLILKQGLARIGVTPPNLKYINYLLKAEAIAKNDERRIWR